ncbi:uncharacterized protein [Centruroides vittatus]|uniref:uncharacterized protein n=1 Tax=Centruroides vittatus TaxID=120091 RepID=UPI003510C815
MFKNWTLLICFLWCESLIIATPLKDDENTDNSLDKEKGSQEDIMFGNQQNKPAGMVDDSLSFPEMTEDNSSASDGDKSSQNTDKQMDKEEENAEELGRRNFPIPANSLIDYYPVYENDETIFRKKRRSVPMEIRNKIEDLLNERQHQRLRIKRQSDILNWLRNLEPDDNPRYFQTDDEGNLNEDDSIPLRYYVMEENEQPYAEADSLDDFLTLNKYPKHLFASSKKEPPLEYNLNNILLPMKDIMWMKQNGAKIAPSLYRRRPLTVNDDASPEYDDYSIYDFLGQHERDIPRDL